MQKESALVALQAIDVIVYKSSHKELSREEIVELQSACGSLIQSVQGNSYIAKRAAGIVEVIKSSLLEGAFKPGIQREEILDRGISLSLFIQRQTESSRGTDEATPS